MLSGERASRPAASVGVPEQGAQQELHEEQCGQRPIEREPHSDEAAAGFAPQEARQEGGKTHRRSEASAEQNGSEVTGRSAPRRTERRVQQAAEDRTREGHPSPRNRSVDLAGPPAALSARPTAPAHGGRRRHSVCERRRTPGCRRPRRRVHRAVRGGPAVRSACRGSAGPGSADRCSRRWPRPGCYPKPVHELPPSHPGLLWPELATWRSA